MIKPKKSDIQAENINKARILYYDFFAGLFIYDLLNGRKDLLLKQIEILKTQPIGDEDEESFEILENEIKQNGVKNLLFEYTRFFMLPFDASLKENLSKNINKKHKKETMENPQVVLYLSYYIDGTIAGTGLVRAKEKIRKSKVRLNEKEFRENEEHFGFLLMLMKNLLENLENKELQNEIFCECINPMYDKILRALQHKGKESLYANVAILAKNFLDFESEMYR